MLGEQPLCNNFGVANIIKNKGIDHIFDDVRQIFADGDIVFGNLECSIANQDMELDQEPAFFCANPMVLKGLKCAHFNVLSVANNHIMEQGNIAYRNLVQLLNENGLCPVGINNKIEILNIKGYKIAFMAYSFIEDKIPNSSYNKVSSEEIILHDIQKVRPLVDIIIISLHWGDEYVPLPSPEQIVIGRKLVDAGADVILGSHPHVTQGYEIYNHRPIIYSLGNFVFDHTYIPTTCKTFIVSMNIKGSLDSLSLDIIPITIDKYDYRPKVASTSQSKGNMESVSVIRNMIENKSLSEYQATIGDYNILSTKYKKLAKRCMRVQFIKNFYRYSPSITLGLIKGALSR